MTGARGPALRSVRGFLETYGWVDGERVLAPFMAAQEVYYEIWDLYRRQRA
ncbi:MAG TPA: hypothetical protein VME22_03510 [Solirubrobacteraceae bacterium]|nr:hypothetical protein [Solirubrobacteraceae bacterium]